MFPTTAAGSASNPPASEVDGTGSVPLTASPASAGTRQSVDDHLRGPFARL